MTRLFAALVVLALACGEARAWTQQAIGFSPAGESEEIIGKLIRPDGVRAATEGNSKSWWDARKQVKAFFAEHLKGGLSPSR